jgi:cytochrome oxidase Cu insertion factor (SCO1/SenC/PrrC family)
MQSVMAVFGVVAVIGIYFAGYQENQKKIAEFHQMKAQIDMLADKVQTAQVEADKLTDELSRYELIGDKSKYAETLWKRDSVVTQGREDLKQYRILVNKYNQKVAALQTGQRNRVDKQ